MSAPGIDPNKTSYFSRTFYTVEIAPDGKIKQIKDQELNGLQRILRALFHWAGAYKNTLTGKEVRALAATKGIAQDLKATGQKAEKLFQKIIAPKEQTKIPEPKITIPPAIEECLHALVSQDLEIPALQELIQAATKARDNGEIALAIGALVNAGKLVLAAGKDKNAKVIAALAQKAGNEALKITPSDEAIKAAKTAANELAANVRVQLKSQNCVIVGKSRSGKTTLMNMVKDVCHVGGKMTMYHGTVNPQFRKNQIQDWNFNISDNPGWGEARDLHSDREYRNDNAIRDLIRGEAQTNLEGDAQDVYQNVDTFIFTFNFIAGIAQDEALALQQFLKEVPKGANKILVITRSETANDTIRAEYLQEMSVHPVTGPLLKEHFKGGDNVLLSGCLDKEQFISPETTKRMQKNLKKQSQALMTALLPLSAKDREAFLEKHEKANAERIAQFTEKEFENQREESLLKRGDFTADTQKLILDCQKAVEDTSIPYKKKVEQILEATRQIADYAASVQDMLDLVGQEVAEANTDDATAKAQALQTKAEALSESFAPFKKEREKYLLQIGEVSIKNAKLVQDKAVTAYYQVADRAEKSAIYLKARDNINTQYTPQVQELIALAERDIVNERSAYQTAQMAIPLDNQTVARRQNALKEAEAFLVRANGVKSRFEEVLKSLV